MGHPVGSVVFIVVVVRVSCCSAHGAASEGPASERVEVRVRVRVESGRGLMIRTRR